MVSRFVGGLMPADLVTLGNAAVGFLAIVIAPANPELAARLVLLAAVADGLDGVVARAFGGSEVGPYLDSLADVASFGVAPAVLVYVILVDLEFTAVPGTVGTVVLFGVPALFVAVAVLRLGFYSAYDTAETKTVGAPSTLAATVLGTLVLTAHWDANAYLIATFAMTAAMIAPIDYPDLLARDALLMGGIHVLAVAMPQFYGRVFPFALLTLALAYLLLAPAFYWGESERRLRDARA